MSGHSSNVGVGTEERIRWLRERGYRYLVVSRERIRRIDPEAARRVETASERVEAPAGARCGARAYPRPRRPPRPAVGEGSSMR